MVDIPDYRIKRIVVAAGHRTSKQFHNKKVETWLVNANGRIVIRNHIDKNVVHRLVGPIEVIDVSHGSDDDIVRLDDDYGRVK